MDRIVICPSCGEEIGIEDEDDLFMCDTCGAEFEINEVEEFIL